MAVMGALAASLCLGSQTGLGQSKYIPPDQFPGRGGAPPPGQIPGQTNPVQLDPAPPKCNTCDDSPGINSNPQQMADKLFVKKETACALAEAQIGKLASVRALSPGVQELGSRISAEQSAFAAALQSIAESLLVVAPIRLDKKAQGELNKLSGLAGNAFDAEYLRFLSKDLRSEEREYGAEMNLTANPGIRNVAATADSVMRRRLDSLQVLAKSHKRAEVTGVMK